MGSILQVFYSAFSGIILSAAIPNEFYNFGLPFFTLFAIVPFYYAIKNAGNYKTAFICGFIQTCTTHLISSFWLAYFKNFAVFTLGASAAGTGFIGGVFGFFLYLPFSSSNARNILNTNSQYKRIQETTAFKIIYFAALYTVYEWVKSTGFLGYPWGTVSSTIYRWPVFMQIASITGTYGITFIFVLENVLSAELIQFYYSSNRSRNEAFSLCLISKLTIILFIASAFFGIVQINKKRIPQKILATIMVQQNSDPWKERKDEKSILRSQRLTVEKMEELSSIGKKAHFIVWSEGCLKSAFPNSKEMYEIYPLEKPLFQFIKEIRTPLLAGGSYIKNLENRELNNAAIVFDGEGNFRGYYGKNHLVPFAEVLPGREIPAVRDFMKKAVGISAGWTPGDQITLFEIPGKWYENRRLSPEKIIDLSKSYSQQKYEEGKPPVVRISTPICFDDAFPDVMGKMHKYGAELFVNITDDSWSLKRSSEIQHFVIASYAAIEYRKTMLRSANSGYSVVISPTGKILAEEPLFEESALSFDVPIYKYSDTVFSRFGNWLPKLFTVLFIIFAAEEAVNFESEDYIPSERKRKSKKKHRKNSKKKK